MSCSSRSRRADFGRFLRAKYVDGTAPAPGRRDRPRGRVHAGGRSPARPRPGRSISWAKNTEAAFRISFARLNSAFSLRSCFNSSSSAVVSRSSRSPRSTSAWRTQPRRASLWMPRSFATWAMGRRPWCGPRGSRARGARQGTYGVLPWCWWFSFARTVTLASGTPQISVQLTPTSPTTTWLKALGEGRRFSEVDPGSGHRFHAASDSVRDGISCCSNSAGVRYPRAECRRRLL